MHPLERLRRRRLDPPRVPRPRHDRASARWRWRRCSNPRLLDGAETRPAPRPQGPEPSARSTSTPGPSGSSTSTWPAGRRTWRRSTTSPSWPRCTASRCPSRSPGASRSPSSRARSSSASPRSTPSASSASRGQEIAEIFPHIGTVADDICIIRSMVTEAINHDPAHTFMNTGTTISGRPAMGSWINYGLGSESEDLPGFVVLTSTGRVRPGPADRRAAVAQRVPPQPVPGGRVPLEGRPGALRRQPQGRRPRHASATSSTPSSSSTGSQNDVVDDPEIATRIAAYEMAFRMQTSVPELIDLSSEPQHVLELYGTAGRRRLVRRQLPAGPPAGRARRPVHPALSPRLGPPRRSSSATSQSTAARGRPGGRGADQGPEAARHARRHAGHLGRRVRPHPDGPGRRPRPPHQGLLDLDGRRRHQGGHHPRRDRRARLSTPSRTSSTSTTSTPRSCTSSASTTPG